MSMDYKTVYETSQQNKIAVIKTLFENNNVRYRVLDEATNAAIPTGARIQVHEMDTKRAKGLLRENGLESQPASEEESVSNKKFWTWFIVAIICLIVAAFLINMLMQGS